MADPAHLEVLRQGIAFWNTWRTQHPEIRPDLSRANLSDADLRGVNFRGANLSKANLLNADLSGADLNMADLTRAMLAACDLSGTNLSRAILSGAYLAESTLAHADMTKAWVGERTLANLDLSTVKGLETLKHQDIPAIEIDFPTSLDAPIHTQGQIHRRELHKADGTDTARRVVKLVHIMDVKVPDEWEHHEEL